MKKKLTLKILVILTIIAILLISFVGIFVTKKGQSINLVPQYILSMNLAGGRLIQLEVSTGKKEVVYDSNGNVVTDGVDDKGNLKEGYTKQDEQINKQEDLKLDNYLLSKNVLEKRIQALGVNDYIIKQDKENGKITLQMPEDSDTDTVLSYLTYPGKFEIINTDTKEVLINNEDVKESKAVYSTSDSGTTVYLSIEFNKDGKNKFEEITKTYIETTDEDGNKTEKTITVRLDGDDLVKTHFDQVITTGLLQLSVGSASTSNTTVASYIEQASQIASLITDKSMALHYEVKTNIYVGSSISERKVKVIVGAAIILALISLIVLVIKYKANGIFASISHIGFIASLLLVLRYTNVLISLESGVALITVFAANYMLILFVLEQIKKNSENINEIIKQVYKRYISIFIPLLLIGIVFTFMSWIPIASIGMVMFWGLILLFIYDYITIKTLLDVQD